jgi:hypothetical protein
MLIRIEIGAKLFECDLNLESIASKPSMYYSDLSMHGHYIATSF